MIAPVSCVRRIVDGAVDRRLAGADAVSAFVESVKALRRGYTPAQAERAARIWARVEPRLDRRGRILPNRDANGRFRGAA